MSTGRKNLLLHEFQSVYVPNNSIIRFIQIFGLLSRNLTRSFEFRYSEIGNTFNQLVLSLSKKIVVVENYCFRIRTIRRRKDWIMKDFRKIRRNWKFNIWIMRSNGIKLLDQRRSFNTAHYCLLSLKQLIFFQNDIYIFWHNTSNDEDESQCWLVNTI